MLILLLFVLFTLIFLSPWYQTDRARENLFEHKSYIFTAKLPTCNCDGTCIYKDSHWVPFGMVIKDCSYDYYYKTFWGKEFYFENKSTALTNQKIVVDAKMKVTTTTKNGSATSDAEFTIDDNFFQNEYVPEATSTPEQALEDLIKAFETNDPIQVLNQLDNYARWDWETDIYEVDLESLARDFRKFPPERIDDGTRRKAMFLSWRMIDGVKHEDFIEFEVENGKWKTSSF